MGEVMNNWVSVTTQSGEQISKLSCGNSQAYTQAMSTMKHDKSKWKQDIVKSETGEDELNEKLAILTLKSSISLKFNYSKIHYTNFLVITKQI